MDGIYNLCFSPEGEKNSVAEVIPRFIRCIKTTNEEKWRNFGLDKSLQCSIKVLSLCDEAFHRSKSCKWRDKDNYQIVINFYFQILKIYFPIYTDEVIRIVIKTVHREKLWAWEDLCQDIIQGLLQCEINQYKIINSLIDKAQSKKTRSNDSRKILYILYTILEDYSWVNDENIRAIILRLLTLYRNSLNHHLDEKQVILKKAFEICLLKTIKHLSNEHLISILSEMSLWTLEMENQDNELILEFANIIEFTAKSYKMDLFKNILEDELFFLLLKMISSSSSSVSLVGNRVLQNLIDRKNNKLQFQTIKLFFMNTDHDIKINKDKENDQEFLKQHRELLHDSFLQCVMNHCSSRVNLESTYCTICLIAVEVPCGFTAAALACLLMNIQDLTLEHLDANHSVNYHVHATVLSIMTLICWIHKAKVFYNYVNRVLMERAQWAPHLNPPLTTHYDFAIHHVLWDKPELFFIDWEVRFGLWKCFRLQTEDDNDIKKVINLKKQTVDRAHLAGDV